jgi:hypothetical protein
MAIPDPSDDVTVVMRLEQLRAATETFAKITDDTADPEATVVISMGELQKHTPHASVPDEPDTAEPTLALTPPPTAANEPINPEIYCGTLAYVYDALHETLYDRRMGTGSLPSRRHNKTIRVQMMFQGDTLGALCIVYPRELPSVTAAIDAFSYPGLRFVGVQLSDDYIHSFWMPAN